MPKSIGLKITIALLIGLLGFVLYAWMILAAKQTMHNKEVSIPQGVSSTFIAHVLEQEHIINSGLFFRWLTRVSGASAQLKPGLYHFDGQLDMFDVLNILKDGKVIQFKVTIPEGLRTDEMLTLLSQRTNTTLKVWQQALSDMVGNGEYEGLFLPETYMYTKPIRAQQLLQQMFDARFKVETAIAHELGWNETQIQRNRIMASIVEKETALAHERVWVSAAIHNRLRLNMPLQMDPTVIYGLYRTQGSFSGNIRRKDLKANTPWNTYTNKGLPPTPICNPGADSLRAAAYPADVNYLYFVADGTGGHAFASTLAEHNANVRKWIRIERKSR